MNGVLENWRATCKRMKLDHCLRPHTNINSKQIRDFNIRPQTIKLLEENMGSKFLDVNLGDDFF